MRFIGGRRGKPEAEQARPTWSVRLRIAMALGAITALALLTMLASVLIADAAQDDAAAINQAGSLRMQSYKLAVLLQEGADAERLESAAQRFEGLLFGDRLQRSIPNRGPVRDRYREVSGHWQDSLRPTAMLDGGDADAYLARVDGFVDALDGLVGALQQEAETRIRLLSLVQGAAIFMTVALVLLAMYLLNSGVLSPLYHLAQASDRLRRGDLSARVNHTGGDEIGLVGASFNDMAEELEQLYRGLERKVEEQTRELRHGNDALRLLYDTARSLSAQDPDATSVRRALGGLQRLIGHCEVSLHLQHPDTGECYASHSTRDDTDTIAPTSMDDRLEKAGFPLESGGARLGRLEVEYPRGDMPAGWTLRVTEALADQLAYAFALAGEIRQRRRLALMEERAVIARELHDSLAQSLSYLKIQVARLEMQLHRGQSGDDAAAILADLREGLNTAYRHLRELLTTFRLKMDAPGLHAAIETTVDEFRRRDPAPAIHLEVDPDGLPLEPNAEIHVLQIIREALTNVTRHARASEVRIRLARRKDEILDVEILDLVVEDDGIGLPDPAERPHHHGLNIIRERARSLGGEVRFEHPDGGGTRVRVRFPTGTGNTRKTEEERSP